MQVRHISVSGPFSVSQLLNSDRSYILTKIHYIYLRNLNLIIKLNYQTILSLLINLSRAMVEPTQKKLRVSRCGPYIVKKTMGKGAFGK